LNHRVLEIGIVLIENGEVISRFQSLVDPEMYIPFNVTLIHGITQDTIKGAPTFKDIASEIEQITQNSIFVAHSVQFDYGFVKAEFNRLGMAFDRKRLCTVRLSKRLLPGLKSHSLASLCQYYQIVNKRAHRALEDAEATATIFFNLRNLPDFETVIADFLNRKSKETSLPPHLKKESFTNLPSSTGVYIFSDQKGKVVYVGKAIDIKDRVGQHFSGNTHTKVKQAFLSHIYEVDYKVTGHELMALLTENELIKKYYPRFNSTNKDFHLNFGIYQYEDQKGYKRLVIGESGKWSQPICVFRTKGEATLSLLKTSMKNGLCLRLNRLIPERNAVCQYEEKNGQKCLVCDARSEAEAYNLAIEKALENWHEGQSYVLQMAGRQDEELGLVWVQNGKIKGYGYAPIDAQIEDLSGLKTYLNSYYDTQDAQSILRPYYAKAKRRGRFEDGLEVLELS